MPIYRVTTTTTGTVYVQTTALALRAAMSTYLKLMREKGYPISAIEYSWVELPITRKLP